MVLVNPLYYKKPTIVNSFGEGIVGKNVWLRAGGRIG
jgi:hypothetical protein